jgi:hypothetical protein
MVEFPTLPENAVSGIVDAVKERLENPYAVAGVGVLTAAAAVGAGVAIAKRRKKKKSKSKRKYKGKSKRGKSIRRRRGRRRGRRTPRTAGRGRDRSTRRIRYTKKGQPYVIMSSGKARFIKKSGARRSHHIKGGRY